MLEWDLPNHRSSGKTIMPRQQSNLGAHALLAIFVMRVRPPLSLASEALPQQEREPALQLTAYPARQGGTAA